MKTSAPFCAALVLLSGVLFAAELPLLADLEMQPLTAQVRRLIDAAEVLGRPFSDEEKAALLAGGDAAKIQSLLDPHCLFAVTINPEMRVKASPGPAKAELIEQGWRPFFIKVINESGTTAPLNIFSPQAQSAYRGGAVQNASDKRLRTRAGAAAPIDAKDVWLDLQSFDAPPLLPTLSGLRLEYRIVSLYSRDMGKREAVFAFDVGQGTQDLGFRGETSVLFTAQPAREIALRVRDEHGKPTTASFEIRDRQRRVYPSPAKRLAPDFGFHPQVYRADGETVRLPDGEYTIDFARGPESVAQRLRVKIGADTRELAFQVEAVDRSRAVSAGGRAIITSTPPAARTTRIRRGRPRPDMMRHCLGEDLKVGANLTWGPCFDYQKQFFTGKDDGVSHASVSAALRLRGQRLWLARIRASVPAAAEGADVSGRRVDAITGRRSA